METPFGNAIPTNTGVLPVDTPAPGDLTIWLSEHDGQDEWNYAFDNGLDEFIGYSDGSTYNGNFGNYENENDNFDLSKDALPWQYRPHDEPADLSKPHWVYSQSSGNLMLVDADGNVLQKGIGYSGVPLYQNNSEAEHIKNAGPIPQGEYEVTLIDNRKGPLSIALSPLSSNEMFGREGFLIHGDNSKGDRSASEGCIILDRAARNTIASSKIGTIIVTH